MKWWSHLSVAQRSYPGTAWQTRLLHKLANRQRWRQPAVPIPPEPAASPPRAWAAAAAAPQRRTMGADPGGAGGTRPTTSGPSPSLPSSSSDNKRKRAAGKGSTGNAAAAKAVAAKAAKVAKVAAAAVPTAAELKKAMRDTMDALETCEAPGSGASRSSRGGARGMCAPSEQHVTDRSKLSHLGSGPSCREAGRAAPGRALHGVAFSRRLPGLLCAHRPGQRFPEGGFYASPGQRLSLTCLHSVAAN